MNSHQISLKNILISVGILFLIGIFLLLVFGKDEKGIYVPTTFEMGNRSGLLLGMAIFYVIFSIAMIWVFFQPKSTAERGAVVGAGLLWGIF